jgi:hypothetical protein
MGNMNEFHRVVPLAEAARLPLVQASGRLAGLEPGPQICCVQWASIISTEPILRDSVQGPVVWGIQPD